MDDAQKQALEAAKERFSKQFFFTDRKVGTFKSDTTHPAMSIINVSTTASLDAEHAEKHYGCPQGKAAILVEWFPAYIVCDNDGKEIGYDWSLIPEKSTWRAFPKTFEEFPVYYARGKRGA